MSDSALGPCQVSSAARLSARGTRWVGEKGYQKRNGQTAESILVKLLYESQLGC
jgi:hypothetical protein